MSAYSAAACDLCGSTAADVLVHDEAGMWSDSRPSRRPLHKIVCAACGLVREGLDYTDDELAAHYGADYALNVVRGDEHRFFRNGVPITRSDAVAEWMAPAIEAAGSPRRIFEVGAGQGNLLRTLARRFPASTFAGCELNEAAAGLAREAGLPVAVGGDEAIAPDQDLILAFCVFEHVPSPSRFMTSLAARLAPGGHLLLAQPMQDVESHDVFFVDHLHHFRTGHIRALGERAGLRETRVQRSPWFAPNVSLHLFTPDPVAPRQPIAYLPPLGAVAAVQWWKDVFARAHDFVERSSAGRWAVFGLSEIAGLLFCYGRLGRLHIVAGLDDFPERNVDNAFGVPVRRLEDLSDAEVAGLDGVVLTLNPVYQQAIARRCADRGLAVVNFFAPAAHEVVSS